MQDLLTTIEGIVADRDFMVQLAATIVGAAIVFIARIPQRLLAALHGWSKRRREGARQEDHGVVRLETLTGELRSTKGAAIRLLMACNEQAADMYLRKCEGKQPTPLQKLIWTKTFTDTAWTGQIHFVEPSTYGSYRSGASMTGTIKDLLLEVEADRPCRIWLTAPAGSGKSTVLLRMFFELTRDHELAKKVGAVPMLIQPANLESTPVRDLASGQREEWFTLFIRTWLANRNIAVSEELMPGLVSDFRAGMNDGRILLLMDGYDEFQRVGLLAQARSLLAYPRLIGAERSDEERKAPDEAIILGLKSTWAPGMQRDYLQKRWEDRDLKNWIELIVRQIEQPGNEWLRNPRNLIFLIEHLEKTERAITEDLLRRLTHSEMDLVAAAFDQAWDRLLRLDSPEIRRVRETDVLQRLAAVAAAEYSSGEYVRTEADSDDAWRCIEAMSGIVTVTTRGVKIDNPLFLEFFLARSIVDCLNVGQVPTVRRRWSPMTVATVAALLQRADATTAAGKVWSAIGKMDGGRQGATESRSITLNLVDVVRRIHEDLAGADPEYDWIVHGNLAELDLDGVDLRRVRMSHCRFEGASLRRASLKEAEFDHCRFHDVEFAGADAFRATFTSCQFMPPDGKHSLAVRGMQIADATFLSCDVDYDTLIDAGADGLHSRYRGSFGTLFNQRQHWLTGEAYIELEATYVDAIRRAALRYPDDQPVYMIDLMAGGSNQRLLSLIAPADGDEAPLGNLHVLAIDRHTRQLDELALPADRFLTWRLHIGGGADYEDGNLEAGIPFADRLALLPGNGREAHLVVAKKAIHELPRDLQPKLIEQCADILVPGGRLILFADSPGATDNEAWRFLSEVRERISSRDGNRSAHLDDLRRLVMNHTFGDGPADEALFCNLWVMLKDWANDNMDEVRNRYFAGRDEIVGWCSDGAGLVLTESVRIPYRLNPARFNEEGVRQVTEILDHDPAAATADPDSIGRLLTGFERARFGLLSDFTSHALFTAQRERTLLGQKLGASWKEVDFTGIHEALRNLQLPVVQGPEFDFAVHVLVFEKPGRKQ